MTICGEARFRETQALVRAIALRLSLPRVAAVTQCHQDTMTRAQSDERVWLDWLPQHRAELIRLGHHGQEHEHLQHCQTLPDALPRPTAKGKVGEAGAAGGSLRHKPFRVEPLRVVPEGRVALQHIGAQ